MSKQKWKEIDNLYALGVVLVVFGHSHSSDWSSFSGTMLESAITFIYIFHMPLFFFIAGFLFMNSDSLERKGYGQWITQKVERLLTPYVVLSVVLLIPKYYVENHGFGGFISYLVRAVFVPRVGVWGHFWFLPVLMLIYVIFGTWKQFVDERNQTKVLIITFLSSIILYFLPYSSDWIGFNDMKHAMIFFVIGMFLNYKKKYGTYLPILIRIIWIVLAISVSILLLSLLRNNKIAMLIIAVMMILACWEFSTLFGENSIISWISKNNFTIYIYSWPFQSIMMVLCGRLHFTWYMTTICMFVIGFICPITIILIYSKMKFIHNRFFDLVLGTK